jgi:hypothetical protein
MNNVKNLEKFWEEYKYWLEGYYGGFILNEKNELTCTRINNLEYHSNLSMFKIPLAV